MKTELLIAWRYFGAKKSEKFISLIAAFSLLGITIGVAALITVMSVMNGFREELVSKIIGLNSDITISPSPIFNEDGEFVDSISNAETILSKLQEYNFIKKANQVILGQGFVTFENSSSGVFVRGCLAEDIMTKPEIFSTIQNGNFEDFTNTDSSILIGAELAANLGVKAGDKLRLISNKLNKSIFGYIPNSKTYVVAAVFNSGLFDYDAGTIIMHLAAAQKLFALPDRVNQIEVFTNDPQNTHTYRKILSADLGPMFRIMDWKMLHSNFLQALDVERATMFMILALIIIVATFNIISGLHIMVKDKAKDIAILKTIGMSKASITKIFVLLGSYTGIIGTMLGVLIGTILAKNIEAIRKLIQNITGFNIFDPGLYFLYELPSKLDYKDVFFVCFISLFCSTLATIYPAIKASSLDPVEIIRNE